jgi:hypothetical protein
MTNSPESPAPLDWAAQQLIEDVRDRTMRNWRGWMRGQNEQFGPELRAHFQRCNFNEEQMAFVWRCAFEVLAYQMVLLMDFLDRYGGCDIQITITDRAGEKFEMPDCPDLAKFYISQDGWEERYGTMSEDWNVEKSHDPDDRGMS